MTFKFHYTVYIAGSSVKVSGGYKDLINLEKEITTTPARRGMVRIEGELNTVSKSITASSYKM